MERVLSELRGEEEGILAWAVEGCFRWQSDGLRSPKSVQGAIEEYRCAEDVVQQFIDERCKMHPNQSIHKTELFRAFRKWTEESGEIDANKRGKRWFTEQLKKRGVDLGGDGRSKYIGIGL